MLSTATYYFTKTYKSGLNTQSIIQTEGETSENQNQTAVNTITMSNKSDNQSQPGKTKIIRLHQQDNVVVALEDLAEGSKVKAGDQELVLTEPISAKHKFALSDLSEGDIIYMYGIKVGVVTKPIKQGAAITTENVKNATKEIERSKTLSFKWTPPDVEAFMNRTFMGYHRSDGQVGTANYWLVIPMVFCENRNTEKIKEAMLSELGYQPESEYRQFTRELVSEYQKGTSSVSTGKNSHSKISALTETKLFNNVTGIKFLTHAGGCGATDFDVNVLCGLLAGYITNANVAGVTVLSLGCQKAQLSMLKEEIKKRDPNFSKPYFELEQQIIGTEEEMIKQAIESTFKGLIEANKIERKPAPLSKLCIGLECGGSDGFSGLSANPAIGYVSDLIVALGGSTILSEFPELSGVEQDLYERCIVNADAEKFITLMQVYNSRAKAVGSGFEWNPSFGNIKDGLITDAMKSAGAAKKGGTAPVSGVLDYPERVKGSGLHLLCTPGSDIESVTGEVGSGATLVLFTTGLGTPTGNPIAPVIKLSTNNALYTKMHDIIDINTGDIITGEETIEQTGIRILNYLIDVASGIKEPAAVRNLQNDFIPWKREISL
jgi:altronate hydrolase